MGDRLYPRAEYDRGENISVSDERAQTLDLNGEYIEHIHLLSSDEARWDNLHLIYEREPAGEMPAGELARHMLVVCLGEFQGSYEIDGTWQHRHYTQGDIAIFPANEPFPKTQVDRDVDLIELFLEPTLLSQTIGKSVDRTIELPTLLQLQDPLIQQIGLSLKAELEAGGVDSRLYASSMAAALSVHLWRRYSSSPAKIQDSLSRLSKAKLDRAITYIHDRLDCRLTLNDIAASVQISPHYFATLFKQSTGRTPHQYVTDCRIEKAKQLLRHSQLSIVEICHRVGFSNQSHFTRVFRKYTQTTPKVYRDLGSGEWHDV